VKSIIGEDNFRNLVWFYINQDEVAAARVRTRWHMSPTKVYQYVHWHMNSKQKMYTKEWRQGYVNATLNAAASNRKTRLPRY
jgi:hypothetical protein